MNGENLPSEANQESTQDNPWSILENYPWHEAPQTENESERVERMVSPLPVINWDEFCAATDEAKHAFVDAVRDDFGPVGYAGFHKIFNSGGYWRRRWVTDSMRALRAGDEAKYMAMRSERPFIEPGSQPSVDAVKKELKSLDYQWDAANLSPKQQKRFNEWYRQCYRVRAGEQIQPFEPSEIKND